MRYCLPFFLVLSLVCSIGRSAELEGSKPNIILVITDDQGYAPVGRHGNSWIKTPNLDALYDTSLRFDRFLVSPTCSPTRAALMTGRHPMKNGITHTILERERMTLDATILPQVLKSAGYTTGIFGKWHLGDEEEYQPDQRGFDEAFIHGAGGIGQAYDCSCADAPDNKYFDPVVRHNGSFVKTEGFCTDVFFQAGLGWIKEAKEGDAPFFAYISTNAPHAPYIAPEKNKKRFTDMGFPEDPAGFYGMIENIDENMGLLLEKLEEWELFEDTLVIFMSDNGAAGGGLGLAKRGKKRDEPMGTDENGSPIFPYNAGMKGAKGSSDEGGVRVPFFVRWDGHIEAGKDIDSLAAHIDILPTLAGLAGAEIPEEQVEGRSLIPLIQGNNEGWADRFLFTHRGRWKTGEEPNDYQWNSFAVRNSQYRLVGDALFDMKADPGQEKDISADHPEVVEELRAAFDEFWKEARPLMVNEDAPMSPTRPFHVWYEEQMANGGIPKWEAPEL
ncbi:MAG: arylsulfatase [Verrucomicrobiales bacterium]|nr:arylsulfatase [Verrucomicrobiales bacterium]